MDRDVIYDFLNVFFFFSKNEIGKKVQIDLTIDSTVIWYVSLTTMTPSNPWPVAFNIRAQLNLSI